MSLEQAIQWFLNTLLCWNYILSLENISENNKNKRLKTCHVCIHGLVDNFPLNLETKYFQFLK